LREFIDWTPVLPHMGPEKASTHRILEEGDRGIQAKQLFAEGNGLLDRIVEKKSITARWRLRNLSRKRGGATMSSSTPTAKRQDVLKTFHFLRQQANREGNEACPFPLGLHCTEGDGACRLHRCFWR